METGTRLTRFARLLFAGTVVFGSTAISLISGSLGASAASTTIHGPATFLVKPLVALRAPGARRTKLAKEALVDDFGKKTLLKRVQVTAGAGSSRLAPDTSGWTIQTSANVLAREGVMKSTSCSSKSACMAAGYYIDKSGTQVAMAEEWNGTSWSVQKLPSVFGSEASSFWGVSCSSATACTAVGAFAEDSDNQIIQVALAESWNGTSWSIDTTPTISGAVIVTLQGVSCTAADSCTAVGGSEDASGYVTTLAEDGGGSSWSIEPTVDPSGSQGSAFNGVACSSDSSSACVTVGDYFDSSGDELPLAESSTGSSWSIESTPTPTGVTVAILSGVACASIASSSPCVAVGQYEDTSGVPLSLAEEWNGTSWNIETTPSPSGSEENALFGVGCTSNTACSAVGTYATSAGIEENLIDTWNGSSWSLATVPLPAGSLLSELVSEGCGSDGTCMATGQFIDTSFVQVDQAESWNGTSWSNVAVKDPKGALDNALLADACPSKQDCVAVGETAKALEVVSTLAEVWNGTSWTVKPTPEPTNSVIAELAGVACSSPTSCTAVGEHEGTSGISSPLAEHWNGTSWKLEPSPPNPSGSDGTYLDGVSCSSGGCTAVGYYSNGSAILPLAEDWNGTNWSIESTADPSGSVETLLIGVSCTSTACIAVGSAEDSAGNSTGIAESWNGSVWSIDATPIPAGAEGDELTGVSCLTADACTAVGDETDSSEANVTLAESWNGTSWSVESTPNPTGVTGSGLAGVSCVSTTCTAIGYSNESSGEQVSLAETWNGSAWELDTTPNPSGSELVELLSVACRSKKACTAAGTYLTGSGSELTLVETGP